MKIDARRMAPHLPGLKAIMYNNALSQEDQDMKALEYLAKTFSDLQEENGGRPEQPEQPEPDNGGNNNG